MPNLGQLTLFAAAGVSAFALLLLIISVGVPVWLDDGNGNTVGLFRACYGSNITAIYPYASPGCYGQNQVTQGGLSVFGLLLLVFGLVALIAAIFLKKTIILIAALGLVYFSSMFVMSAYATWGTYSRDPSLYAFPYNLTSIQYIPYTSMGAAYHLCVASHYFLWTGLTLLAFGAGYNYGSTQNTEAT